MNQGKPLIKKDRISFFPVESREIISKEPLDEVALSSIISTVDAQTDVDFTHYRKSTLIRRINRRMLLRKCEKMSDYAHLIHGDSSEVDSLFQDILINVTGFFRDPEVYEGLKKDAFPGLFHDGNENDMISIWVPACSTGEEPYSIAVSILEYLDEHPSRVQFQILASDINEQCIKIAQIGEYSEKKTENVSNDRLTRFFEKDSLNIYRVSKEIRDLVTFTQHDVLADPPLRNLDLISCRNLMIYLDFVLQERLIPIFYHSLKENSFLVLGKAESPGKFKERFNLINKESKIYQKKPVLF